MVEHLLEFCVLIRRKHGFKAVIARGHERFHLLSFLLREKIVILVDGLNLAAQAFLAGLDFSYLVIAEAEAQLEPGPGTARAIRTACGGRRSHLFAAGSGGPGACLSFPFAGLSARPYIALA